MSCVPDSPGLEVCRSTRQDSGRHNVARLTAVDDALGDRREGPGGSINIPRLRDISSSQLAVALLTRCGSR